MMSCAMPGFGGADQRFARHTADIHTRSANRANVDQANLFAEFLGSNRGSKAARTAADHQQIEVVSSAIGILVSALLRCLLSYGCDIACFCHSVDERRGRNLMIGDHCRVGGLPARYNCFLNSLNTFQGMGNVFGAAYTGHAAYLQ